MAGPAAAAAATPQAEAPGSAAWLRHRCSGGQLRVLLRLGEAAASRARGESGRRRGRPAKEASPWEVLRDVARLQEQRARGLVARGRGAKGAPNKLLAKAAADLAALPAARRAFLVDSIRRARPLARQGEEGAAAWVARLDAVCRGEPVGRADGTEGAVEEAPAPVPVPVPVPGPPSAAVPEQTQPRRRQAQPQPPRARKQAAAPKRRRNAEQQQQHPQQQQQHPQQARPPKRARLDRGGWDVADEARPAGEGLEGVTVPPPPPPVRYAGGLARRRAREGAVTPSGLRRELAAEQKSFATEAEAWAAPRRRPECKFWLRGACTNDPCTFSHDVPCRFHHLFGRCTAADECRFSHAPMLPSEVAAFRAREEATKHDAPGGRAGTPPGPPQPASLAPLAAPAPATPPPPPPESGFGGSIFFSAAAAAP